MKKIFQKINATMTYTTYQQILKLMWMLKYLLQPKLKNISFKVHGEI